MGQGTQLPKHGNLNVMALSDSQLARELAICDLEMRQAAEWSPSMASAERRYEAVRREIARRKAL